MTDAAPPPDPLPEPPAPTPPEPAAPTTPTSTPTPAAPRRARPPRSRRRRIVFAVVFTLASILLAIVTLEVYLRLRLPASTDQPAWYVQDFDLGKRLVPGYQGTYFGQPLSVNSFGMRDAETTLARRPGARRILALGDSWTFGAGVPTAQVWPEQLERLLGGPDAVEVLNTGVSGYETYHEAFYYRNDLQKFEHDLVLVGFYPLNDVHDKQRGYERMKALHDLHPVLYDIYKFPKRLMITQVYTDWRKRRKTRKRAERYAQLHQHTGSPFAGEEDWTELYTDDYSGWRLVKESLRSIGETARACGVKGAVVLFPDLRDLRRYETYCHPRVAPKLEEACRAAGLELIDLVGDFSPYVGREPEVSGFPGSTHPSGAGCEVIARAVAREVAARKLLER